MNCVCNNFITCNKCRINKMRSNTNNVLVIDIDGTITNNEYPYDNCTPKQDVINKVNECYKNGWIIKLLTARGQNTFNGDSKKADEYYRELTEDWLRKNRVLYHSLSFEKPAAIFYIDDRALRPEEFKNAKFANVK